MSDVFNGLFGSSQDDDYDGYDDEQGKTDVTFHEVIQVFSAVGMTASGSAALLLFCRLIPAIAMPTAIMTVGGFLAFCTWMVLRPGDQRLHLLLAGLGVFIGVASGGWDGMPDLLRFYAAHWYLPVGLIAICGLAIAIERALNRREVV